MGETLIALVNFGVLIVSSVLFTVFYVKSVSPAALERRIGETAYRRCGLYRVVSSVFMFVACANYVLYHWYPLPLPVSPNFPWDWGVSAAIATVIALPSLYLMFRGIKDAGEETMLPKKDHTLYGGIYEKIRHPQAVGEFPLWWVIAFLVNSPFLVMFSFAYIPVWYYMCWAEERDLLLRYGAAYEEYRRNVGFWLPRRGRNQEAP